MCFAANDIHLIRHCNHAMADRFVELSESDLNVKTNLVIELLICSPPTNHDVLRSPSSIIVNWLSIFLISCVIHDREIKHDTQMSQVHNCTSEESASIT